jgi:3-isopropylmalate/(R)-2-methylmalate dehydratase large subunit
MGRTIVEKVFADHVGHIVKAGDVVIAPLDFVFWDDSNRPQACEVFRQLGGRLVFDPSKVAAFLDHAGLMPNPAAAAVHNLMRQFSREQGTEIYEIGQGIEHQLTLEKGKVVPGDLIIGADSHTCTYGALNALGTGVGSSDIAVGMLTGKLWFKVPHTVQFVLEGELPPGVYAKDLILHLIRMVGAGGANYQAVEFGGPTIASLSVDSRLTISNMAVEMGAKFGLMEADETTVTWVHEHSQRPFTTYTTDPDADILQKYRVDVSTLEPLVAKPHSPANGCPVVEMTGTPIQQAVLGTCTNGRLEDLREAARVLRGRRLAPGVRLFVTPASLAVLRAASREGLIDLFLDAGAVIGTPGCGGCTGGSGLGIPADGENMITTANRNFKGRTGNKNAFIYLASPATVIASAIEGAIADPRPYL